MAMIKVLKTGRYADDNVRIPQFELVEGEVKDLPDSLAEKMIKVGSGESATVVATPKPKKSKITIKRTSK
tara:strand:- start:624 stop:833 length:210 start_codon:yes stop_codon:yes gene_type:complete